MIDETDQALPGAGITPVDSGAQDGRQPAVLEGPADLEGGHGQHAVEHGWDPSARAVNRAIIIGTGAGILILVVGVLTLAYIVWH